MNRRTAIFAATMGLTLPLAFVASSAMADSGHADPGAPSGTHRVEPPRANRHPIVVAGTLTAVDTSASTVTLFVRGGRDKALRRTSLTVTVPVAATITRDDAVVPLAQLQAGDSVTIRSNRIADVVTVTQVSAHSRTSHGEPSAEPSVRPSVQPTVAPTVQPTADPTVPPSAS